jgi:TPR repeat protein
LVGIALAAAGIAAAASAFAAPASSGYDEGLAAYRKNDYAKSLKVLRPLAERGDARAQYLIGRQYQFGQAVKADRAEAYYWYKRAEAKGHLEAKLFRLLLEKRWKITAAEKGRAERRIAAENAPKPRVARVESRPTPRPERVEASKPAEKPGPAASAAERDATAKRTIETARASESRDGEGQARARAGQDRSRGGADSRSRRDAVDRASAAPRHERVCARHAAPDPARRR